MLRYRISHNGKFCLTNAMVKRWFGVFAVKIVEYRSKIEIFITDSYPYHISDTATLTVDQSEPLGMEKQNRLPGFFSLIIVAWIQKVESSLLKYKISHGMEDQSSEQLGMQNKIFLSVLRRYQAFYVSRYLLRFSFLTPRTQRVKLIYCEQKFPPAGKPLRC